MFQDLQEGRTLRQVAGARRSRARSSGSSTLAEILPLAGVALTVLGWGSWFPWSAPAILAGAGGAQVEPVTVAAVLVVVVVVLAGSLATIAWWERADQTG
jgi:hypothetical protein